MSDYDLETKFTEALGKISNNALKIKLVALRNCFAKRQVLEKKNKQLVDVLDKKYDKIDQPVLEERNAIVNNLTPLTTPSLEDVPDKDKFTTPIKEPVDAPVTDYWLTVLRNTDDFYEQISDKDEPILKNLKNVKVVYEEGAVKNYSLVFEFKTNEFFPETFLEKKYIYCQKKLEIEEIKSIKPTWASDAVNPTIKFEKKKVGKGKSKKTVNKKVEDVSFFNFFKDYKLSDIDMEDEAEEEDSKSYSESNEDDLIFEEEEIGNGIKDEVIPYSLEYFLNARPEQCFDGCCDDGDDCDEGCC